MIKIYLNGHRISRIKKYLEIKGSTIKDFVKELEDLILQTFSKKTYIFHLGGSDGINNIVGWILIKNNYKFELFVPDFDINGRNYWDQKEHKVFQDIKEKALKIHQIDGDYLKRNRVMEKETEILLSFMLDARSGTGKTIKYWEKRIGKENVKEKYKGKFVILTNKLITN